MTSDSPRSAPRMLEDPHDDSRDEAKLGPRAFERGFSRLLLDLPLCRSARELCECLGRGLADLYRPASCAVYFADGERLEPGFARPSGDVPSLCCGTPLAVRGESDLLDGSAPGRHLAPEDRAALERLRAVVLVPIRRPDRLLGMIALGQRSAGGRYGSSELLLLQCLASHAAGELHRLGETLKRSRQRKADDSLRRYVPRAIADRIASGDRLGCGEREVSVLFVDMRGYTSYAERLSPEQIFSVINRYTQTVSRVVWAHGGTIVEFNGDGMMAVFGAPNELRDKERAAVEAGRSMVLSVQAIPPIPGNGPVRIGVGIASGQAFVGNIETVDRVVWSAVGNTTNLAARLQGLTHELDAPMVIDRETWCPLGPCRRRFRPHPGVEIRGREKVVDVYALEAAVWGDELAGIPDAGWHTGTRFL